MKNTSLFQFCKWSVFYASPGSREKDEKRQADAKGPPSGWQHGECVIILLYPYFVKEVPDIRVG